MSEKFKVSVIIPSYNYAQYLSACIESVNAQTYTNWEAIIVDDGSSDNTPAVARELVIKYPGKITYIRTENKGVTHARNLAVEKSKGEFILPLDADDVLLPMALEEFVQHLTKDDKIGFAYCAVENFGPLPGDNSIWTPGLYSKKSLQQENLAACTSLWRRELWQKGVRYREFIFEDWDLWLQIAAQGYSGCYIPKVLFQYRMHPHGRNTTNRNRYTQAWIEEVLNNPQIYPENMIQWATICAKNYPQSIKLPTIVFVLEKLEKELLQLAKHFIACGYFVAVFEEDASQSQAVEGLTRLALYKENKQKKLEEQLYKIGKELILISNLPSNQTAQLKTLNNLLTLVSLRKDYDAEADFNLAITDTGIEIDTRRSLAFRPASIKSIAQLADAIVSTNDSNRDFKQKCEKLFYDKLFKLVGKSNTEAEPNFNHPSLSIIVSAFKPNLNSLKNCFASIRKSIGCEKLPIHLIAKLESDVDRGNLNELLKSYQVDFTDYGSDLEWNRAKAMNNVADLTKSAWLCFIDGDVCFSKNLIKRWAEYYDEIGRSAIYISEAKKYLSLSGSEATFASKICGALFVSRGEYDNLGKFDLESQLFEEVHNFLTKAKLKNLRKVLLDEGLTIKQWHIPSDSLQAKQLERDILSSNFNQQQKYELLFQCGQNFIRAGEIGCATEIFEELLCYNQSDSNAQVALAHAYLLNGNIPRASHYALSVLSKDSRNTTANEVLNYIKNIVGE